MSDMFRHADGKWGDHCCPTRSHISVEHANEILKQRLPQYLLDNGAKEVSYMTEANGTSTVFKDYLPGMMAYVFQKEELPCEHNHKPYKECLKDFAGLRFCPKCGDKL